MATDKRKGRGKGKGKDKGGDDGDGGGGDNGDDKPQGPGEHEDDETIKLIHEEYLQRHLGGGVPATPEAYERAAEQFNRLPGAWRVRTKRPRPPRTGEKPEDDKSEEPS